MIWKPTDFEEVVRRMFPSLGFATQMQKALQAVPSSVMGDLGIGHRAWQLVHTGAATNIVDSSFSQQFSRMIKRLPGRGGLEPGFLDVVKTMSSPASHLVDPRAGLMGLIRQMVQALPEQLLARSRTGTAHAAGALTSIAVAKERVLPFSSANMRSMAAATSLDVAAKFGLETSGLSSLADSIWRRATTPNFAEVPLLASAMTVAGELGMRSILSIDAALRISPVPFDESELSLLLGRVDDALDGTLDASDVLSQSPVVPSDAWFRLPEPVRAYVIKHHLGLLSILLSATWFLIATLRSHAQTAAQAEHEAQHAAHAAHEEQRAREFEDQLLRQNEVIDTILAAIATEQQSAGAEGDVTALPDRFVKRASVLRARPKGRSSPVARVVEGQAVTLVLVRGRWAQVAYPDLVNGVPRVGWIRKKYLLTPKI